MWQTLQPYPAIRLDWRADLGLVDVVDERVDVGVRFGQPEDSRLIIRKVGVAEDCIVATPDLLARTGTPADWQALQQGYPLSALLNPNTGRAWAWSLSASHQFYPNQPKLMSNTMQNELISVLAGQTIACLPRLMCQPYLATGELTELFPEIARKQWQAYVYRPQRNVTHPRVKVVFDALVAILQTALTLPSLQKSPTY